MIINDRIYGEIEITDKVIIELIQSKPFQRLKRISQDGASHFIQPNRNVTRYEHSIGVWYLSHKFNRPIEEQIAALLHDLPHTAFSHVIDFVMNDEKHEFHEKYTEKLILNSEIPQILKKYKINIKKVLNKENYDLLENNLPDISVDRWDYFMRDTFMMSLIPKLLIQEFLNKIKVEDNKFYFEDIRLAASFAIYFVNCSRLVLLDPTSHGAYFLLANAIKKGIDLKVINEEDFFTDDETVLNKLKNINDKEINKYLDRLKPGKEFIYAKKEEAEFFGPNKPRYVDPLVKVDGELKRVSTLVSSLEYFFKEFSQNYKYLGVVQIIK